MKTVLCITLNPAIDMTVSLDVLTLGAVNRANHSQLGAAGKGLNVAHILSELGINGVASGFLGSDNDEIFRHLFISHADFKSVDGIGCMTDSFIKVLGSTRTNIKIVDGAGCTTDINGKGFSVSNDDKQALFDVLPSLAKNANAVLVAGSLPQGFDAADFDKLLTLLTACHDKVAVDVSGQALKVALKHSLWLIKPNNHELSEAFGYTITTLDEQIKALNSITGKIKHILVSMGEQGVHWFDNRKEPTLIYKAVPPKMTVKSTVGAGDTMVAGMIFGLLKDLPAPKVLAKATALSAYVVSIVDVKVPNSIELDRLIGQTQVSQIDYQ